MLVTPESEMPVVDVGTEGVWIRFRVLQLTIAVCDNVLVLLN